MDFLKRLFSPTVIKSYVGGTWTTSYPTDIDEKQLLESNKEWVYIAVDKNANEAGTSRQARRTHV
jgi:hypothetical protein